MRAVANNTVAPDQAAGDQVTDTNETLEDTGHLDTDDAPNSAQDSEQEQGCGDLDDAEEDYDEDEDPDGMYFLRASHPTIDYDGSSTVLNGTYRSYADHQRHAPCRSAPR